VARNFAVIVIAPKVTAILPVTSDMLSQKAQESYMLVRSNQTYKTLTLVWKSCPKYRFEFKFKFKFK
jgi:hypothetical protein